jgi:hypothetical protein
MNVATPSSHAKTTLKEALAKREILMPTGDNSRKWRLTGGMLPGHGISLSWEPKLP